MPQITIDGKKFDYEGQPMLLQFALDHSVEIPYFCYHPAMTIPTNCRMCLVDVGYPTTDRVTGELKYDESGELLVNWVRKPATACNTPLSPNMVVRTQRTSATVQEMQKSVLEYMLVNHPLDCPICDQAGECPLQIWTYKYGPEGSRFETSKIHRPKRVELGPNVVLDAERCINCTRCVRFTDEISKSGQLTIVGRGEKNYPTTGPDMIFDDPYSMNTIDLCPVGALTSKDFRFKARTWEMAYTPGLCTGCAKGCNVDVWVRDNQVLRLTPRENAQVNQYWMCDEGRLDIAKYNERRVTGPRLQGDVPVDFPKAVEAAAAIMRGTDAHIYFLGSSRASLEGNYALKTLAKKYGNQKVHYLRHESAGWGDDFLRRDDRSPNTAGCEALDMEAISIEEVLKKLHDGSIKVLYMLEDTEAIAAIAASDLSHVKVIAHATQQVDGMDKFAVVLPAATEIETESIFVNEGGKAQYSRMAKQIQQMTPEMWMRVPKSRLDKAAVAIDNWRDVENIYDVLPSWRMLSMVSKAAGKDLMLKEHRDVVSKLKPEVDAVREMNISYKVPKEAFKITQFDFAIR